MKSKVIKLLVVVDEDTAEAIEELSDLSPKEREKRVDKFVYLDSRELPHELHFILGEVI